ncbi:hypothetical protein P4O66_003241 [Electrophorus voltai]|uniref:HEPN domain-containing protein n=1 Tax=Electrophorus voltai TaxID=2609070 RepID=A0AAD8YRC3_9TELE|nr:hypothetical protein P4O66_003241 [Electrophorus voltai]
MNSTFTSSGGLGQPNCVRSSGAALYVYNDAVFTAEDWNGIQEIARSRKREDPLKVGRFGIGFNSVYHITDVPSIFSGDQIAMLDPHQLLFGVHESGQCWNLKSDIKEVTKLSDQFAPFVGLFGSSEKTIADGNFPGTLFRFPLRTKPSQLSSNIYNKEKVLELFESFKADADTVLLFLKSVQKVSLHTRESDGTERLLFQVTAGENSERKLERPTSLKTLDLAINNYSNSVPNDSVTCATYQLAIDVYDKPAKEKQKTMWLVCNAVGGRGMCRELDSLADDLKFIPTIGIALPLTHCDEAKGATSSFSGRAFCFLPLPLGEESLTGLPVHVSGFFGLTDNRRSIKWREVDQWRDPAALWNELLITTVMPRAYYTLITETIKRIQANKNQDFPLSPRALYGAWPDTNRIRPHWRPIIEPLYHDLLQQPVIFSLSSTWVNVEDAVFSELDSTKDCTETVIEYLQSSGITLAQVPVNAAGALDTFATKPESLRKVTPSFVRQTLRKARHTGALREKLLLLEFILSDGCYSDLIGLEMLPLQNESFVAFSSSVSDKDAVYVASEEYPRSSVQCRVLCLFQVQCPIPVRGFPVHPGNLLLSGSLGQPTSSIPNKVERLLFCASLKALHSGSGFNSREICTPHKGNPYDSLAFQRLCRAVEPRTFEDMPLIPNVPLNDSIASLELLRLKAPSPIIVVHEEEGPLCEVLLEVIKKLGGVVLSKLDPCLQHPLLKNYFHQLSPSTLLQIMDRASSQRLSSQVSSLTGKQKNTLRGFLAGLTDVTEKEKRIIQDLPIFVKVGQCSEKGTPSFTSLKGARALHHSAKCPSDVKLSIHVVESSDEATIRLVGLLNVEQVKSAECLKVILQDIDKGFYSKDEVRSIMLWVLTHFSFLKNENKAVVSWLSSLKFIFSSSGKMLAATDLFDPELEILQTLFYMEEETRFPPDTYTSSPDILHSLRQLGLKNEVQLTEKDVLQIAQKIEELQGSSKPEWESLRNKAKTLLMILNKQTKLVKSSEVQTSLKKLKWVPVCKDRPLNYPKTLAWKGDTCNISSLSEMCDMSHAVLVGSSVALVERTSVGMKKALMLSIEPQVDQVLQHLKAVNDWHRSQAFTTEDWYQFQQILFEIYDFMQVHLEDAREALKSLSFDWVWTGRTFASPGHTALKHITDLDLQPFLYSLPKTIAKFHKLFKFCGSVDEIDANHVFEVVNTIKERSEQEMTKKESKHNILLLINILRWLYNSQISVNVDMHVPILCYKDPGKLVMKPIHECTYCDIKVDDLNDLLDDTTEPIILVHDDIPMKTAEWLRVPCLSTRLINPENLGFEQSGQTEPLTVRIKNILEEYPSVADIFKELLQNADDANATECSFLIDMRKNLDIRENLLDPGMMVCHGPALWSFNNSVFSDRDFLNITRLGGSMKRCEADKVGTFGLGFNSVYHVTDIPIIMSREFMIMFDPNINHISKHIRDKSNPGIKINWSKQQKRLRKFPNQFKPFVNVFNCQLPLSQESPYKYDGTLFRLPFRTENEAATSEISSIYYNTPDIYSLVDEFSICGHRLILFTQHVGMMVLKYLKSEDLNPAAAQDVVTINKSVWSSKAAYGPLSILRSAAKAMKKVAATNRVPADIPKSGCIIRIVVEEFHNVFRRILDLQSPLFRGSEEDPSSYFEIAAKGSQTKRLIDEMPQKAMENTNWLICSCMDATEALKFSLSESGKRLGLVPCGGIAVLLSEEENRKWTLKTNASPIGEVFCYLPLRIKTGLPVHINGCFAVTSNRKEIWKTDTKGQWNSIFMRHVIVQAYLAALNMLRTMSENGELLDYSYYAAWPDPGAVHDDFNLICQGVYQEIAKGGSNANAKVFSDGKTWVSIKYVRFLDDSLLCRPDVGPAAFKIFMKYLKCDSQDLCAVDLPDWVKEGFVDAGCKEKLMENTLTERRFFSDVFFPHIQDIDRDLRDPLMHYVLNEKLDDFADILRGTPCIPCSGPSHRLVLPSRLIHPEGRVAKLYHSDDGRFPEGSVKDYLNPICLVKLVELDGDRLKRKQFHASVVDSVIKKKNLTQIPVQQITYTMDIEDSGGNSTTWLVCNRSGFSDMEKVSKSVISAHKNEDITLFPRGGVAACTSHNYKKAHRAFCFLPLSLETGLPFHVNGHFALDSARRNLWRDDNGVGVRSDWNSNLMMLLIAPAYVELLVQLKRRLFPGPDPTMTVLQGTPVHVVKDTLRKFLFFFPVNRLDIQPDWYCLVKAIYQCIHVDLKRLLPVVRAPQIDNTDIHSAIYICWVNTSPSNKSRAFFDNLLQDELQHLKNTEYNITTRKSVAENVYRLKAMLLDVGFNLVHSCDETASLYFCLEDSGIPVSYVTPEDVRNFLLTFSSPDTSCQIGKLPCRLQQSNVKLFHSLKLLVDYCFKDIEEDDVRIEGLPLLLTMDNSLQVFDSKRPKFLTTHHELIPSRKELFMNNLYMRYSHILFKAGVAKIFDISSFGDLLGSVLPREYRTRVAVRWKENYASDSWLRSVWNFINENIGIKDDQTDIKPKFETVLDILKDWALLPGIKFMVSSNKLVVPEHDVLLPLSLVYAAIFPNGQNDKVFHTVMKAGCFQVAINKICAKENPILPLLAQHTANVDNPSSILRAIEYMIQTSAFKAGSLTEKDFEALLLYFNSNLNNLSPDDVQSLKLLPCYRAVSGRHVSIASFGACYVLTKSIPSIDIEKWAHTTSSTFLVDNSQLKELYTFLGCTPIDDLEVYLKHLLPKFDILSYDAKIQHMIYLKEQLMAIEEACGIRDQLYEKLESLSFIYDSTSRLKPATAFYDQTVKVFEVMLPPKSFIPAEFFRKIEQMLKPKNGISFLPSWITFLRMIGLKYIVSQQQVLQFAKEISIKAQTENWSKEKVQTIDDVLLNHIFGERTDLFEGQFLKELSAIPFLFPERAPAELVRLHPQYQEINGSVPLIRFNGSQVNPKFKQTDIMQLLWTSCPILPEKATPVSITDQEGSPLAGQEQLDKVLAMLNVNIDPPLEKVISNCKNICSVTNLDDDTVKTRYKVLKSTYEFLNADKREFRQQLRGVAFVMVEEGWKLLKPEEVVINLDNESDFKPYLYKLPLELGTFHQLFKVLGTEDTVSTKQYVEVLCRIYRSSEGKQLDPNEMRTVKRAVSGLFKSLQNDPVHIRKDLETLREFTFYLPSHDGRLAKSNSLVFDDAPHYKGRIQGNVGVQMLVDMSQCYLGKDHTFHTKLITLLPQKLRPRLLSSILEEQLDEESQKMCQFGALCSLQGRLQLLLSSEQFITGLIRIMKHENDNAYMVNEEKAIRLCKALCEGLKVSCFEKLQTTLRVKGCSPIPHSKSETLAFLKRYGASVIHLYIQHSDSKDINFLLALAMTLKSATDNLISDTSYLIAMLGCNDIYRITEKLDNLGVKYDSTEPSKLELPLPGTPIPAEIHHILLMDPMNVFYPGEYVGYLVDSEGGDILGSYQPTYTYAIIVQEVEREEDDNPSFLGKCYQIDIGYSEYKIVSSLDLYKFSRQDDTAHIRDGTPPAQTSPSESKCPDPRMVPPIFTGKENHIAPPTKISPKKIKLNALPEILKEVTSVVEQAWRLPETERKKIIRRLYLKWHPDKNAENLDIATEVFKHLQNEINRMERQAQAEQTTDRATRRTFSTSSTRFQSEKFSFQRFYTSWNQEATSHKSERQQFREQFTSYAGTSHSSRFFVPPSFKSVGNPVEARRWLRQARANFSAARNDLHKNANEWVCFKCFLATKLALIAADYAVRGKSDKDVKPTALAQKVEEYNSQLTGLAKDVQILEGYGVDSLRTRYPDLLPFPQIPNDRMCAVNQPLRAQPHFLKGNEKENYEIAQTTSKHRWCFKPAVNNSVYIKYSGHKPRRMEPGENLSA